MQRKLINRALILMAGPPEAHHAATSGASPSRLNVLLVTFNITAGLEYSIKVRLGPTHVQNLNLQIIGAIAHDSSPHCIYHKTKRYNSASRALSTRNDTELVGRRDLQDFKGHGQFVIFFIVVWIW